MVGAEHIHSKYLHMLTQDLYLADIDVADVEFTLVEPLWCHGGRNFAPGQERTLCDLIVGLKDGSAIPIELKSSLAAKGKAVRHLSEGTIFAAKVLHRPVVYVL